MANEVVNRRLNIYIDQSGAEEALGRLTKKENELLRSIEKSKAAGKDFTREMQKLGETRQSIGQLNDLISGKILPSVKQAEAAVSKLRREIRALPADSEAAKNKLLQFKQAEAVLKQVKDQAFGVNRAMDDLKKDRGIKGIFDNAFSVFLGGGLIGVVSQVANALGALFTDSISEALDAEKATARLRSTLNNLGQDAVFERLSKSAEDFADTFKFIDNDQVIGVFEQLITYGKLTEKQINQLTPVIIDFASKSQISLEDSASLIIKALEGNGKALKEYGIDIKDAKDVTEAFGVIMDELKPKVDGAAKAFGETTAGQIAITRQEIDNLKEDIGTKLLPVTKDFYTWLEKSLGKLKNLFGDLKILNDKEAFGALDRIRYLTGTADDDLKARIEAVKKKNRADAAVEKLDEFGRVTRSGSEKDTVIGTGEGRDLAAEQAAEKLRQQAAEKRKKELDELTKKYKEFSATIKGEALDEEMGAIFAAFRKINEEAEKDLAQLKEFQKAGLVTAAEADTLTKAINDILEAQRVKLQEKFKLNPVQLPIALVDNSFTDTNADAGSFGKKIFADLEKGLQSQGRDAFAALELAFLQSTGKKKLDANNALLEAEKEQELSNKELTENEKLVIEEKYRQLRLEAEMSYWMEVADIALLFSAQIADISNSINQIRTNNENAALEKEVANNDERRKSFKKLLDNKVITQKEYDRRVAALDAQQEARETDLRKKQFQRDKNAQTVQALISGAQAVLSTLARFGAPIPPNFLGIGAMALTVATTAASVAAIRSQKPPQFEKGGFIPEGSSHKQGGISLIDNRTGSNVGEVEGGEPIISKKVYAQNRSLIDSLIWKGNQPQSMNIPRLNSSMQRMGYFESGGFIPGGSAQDNKELLNAINLLNERLSVPLRSNVIYGEYEEVSDKINAVRNAAVIR